MTIQYFKDSKQKEMLERVIVNNVPFLIFKNEIGETLYKCQFCKKVIKNNKYKHTVKYHKIKSIESNPYFKALLFYYLFINSLGIYNYLIFL